MTRGLPRVRCGAVIGSVVFLSAAFAAERQPPTAPNRTQVATQAKPRLLILYHASLSLRPAVDAERSTPATLLSEMSRYPGHVVVGRDLDVY